MIRQQLIKSGIGKSITFRMRGADVSRLEGLTDTVFGFAITLLVISQKPPTTFTELTDSLRELPVFAVCFALLIFVWYWHYVYFRRYGLDDGVTRLLNAVLLGVILVYVYPLRFLFSLTLDPTAQTVTLPNGRIVQALTNGDQVSQLYLIYGLGFAAVFLTFELLYLHAYRQRDALELNALERLDTRASISANAIQVAVALLSILSAYTFARGNGSIPGYIYLLISIGQFINGIVYGRRRRALEAQLASDSAAAPALPQPTTPETA